MQSCTSTDLKKESDGGAYLDNVGESAFLVKDGRPQNSWCGKQLGLKVKWAQSTRTIEEKGLANV